MKKINSETIKKHRTKMYYAQILHSDAKLILIMMIISIICEIIFQASSHYDYLILIILYVICISYDKRVKKKSLGIVMIIAALLLIFESLINFSSLFNLIFLFLGVFSMYHSICYLKKQN